MTISLSSQIRLYTYMLLRRNFTQIHAFLSMERSIFISVLLENAVPLDLSTPTGMSCIGTYGENCKPDSVSKYRVLLVAFNFYDMRIDVTEKGSKFIVMYLFCFLFSEN